MLHLNLRLKMPVITRNQRKNIIAARAAVSPSIVSSFQPSILQISCQQIPDSKIVDLKYQRPQRNIKRVNYTGMDSIEPESEFDGITDIWADITIEEDPDYEFEEEYDHDEDEEQTTWPKIHPELSTEEKTELKQHLNEIVEHHRVKRNIARVNYAGMDMNEDDEGEILISKRRFEDGKVKYIWKSYPLSQANEIEDEDYVDEE